jgi:hypothetical protein
MAPRTRNPISPRVNFFISYTGTDVEWARWIAWELKSDAIPLGVKSKSGHCGQETARSLPRQPRLSHQVAKSSRVNL